MALIKCAECDYTVSEHAAACVCCGFPISKNHPTNIDYRPGITAINNAVLPPERKKPVFAIILCALGMFTGGYVAYYSWSLTVVDIPYVRQVTFGGDFYTYIHEATASAANNVGVVLEFLVDYSIVSIGIGVFIFLFFALKLNDVINQYKQN